MDVVNELVGNYNHIIVDALEYKVYKKPEELWTPIGTTSKSPQYRVECPKCHNKNTFHPNYIAAGITRCCRKGCYGKEILGKEMVIFRGWKYLGHDGSIKHWKINIECNMGHIRTINLDSLRLGCNCRNCSDTYKSKNNTKNLLKQSVILDTIPEIVNCNCRQLGLTKYNVCSHYNFGLLYPRAASEWSYKLNGNVTPFDIAPRSDKKCWFYCENIWCNMAYLQKISHRTNYDTRCPYCYGSAVCLWNCLATTHPKLCQELDKAPDNIQRAKEITHGTHIELIWNCKEYGEKHKWLATPATRISGSGCPICNKPGMAEILGGKQRFVNLSNKFHNFQFEYIGDYNGAHIETDIYCSKLIRNSDPPQAHGVFRKRPNDHLAGQGCPQCTYERKGSLAVIQIKECLMSLQIKFQREVTFPDLKYINNLFIDFFVELPSQIRDSNLEYDGGQHFRKSWNGEQGLIEIKIRDCIKDLYCVSHGMNLWRIHHKQKITLEMIKNIIYCFSTGIQVYASYSEYIAYVKERFDLSNIMVFVIDPPVKKQKNKTVTIINDNNKP